MKNLKVVLSTLLVLLCFTTSQAQKTPEAQRKAIENAMNYGKNKVDAASIPSKYSFNWNTVWK